MSWKLRRVFSEGEIVNSIKRSKEIKTRFLWLELSTGFSKMNVICDLRKRILEK